MIYDLYSFLNMNSLVSYKFLNLLYHIHTPYAVLPRQEAIIYYSIRFDGKPCI